MKSKEEFKKACDSHVDVKLEMTLKKARCRKEVQKSQRALNTMIKTHQTIALELQKTREIRKEIQDSELYTPKPKTGTESQLRHGRESSSTLVSNDI